jgi:2,5-diketo-D-gluconate reductase B
MIYVRVQGEDVPALGLGTWELMGSACREAVEHALAIGYRHLDTAQGYGNEAEVGEGLKRSSVPRDEVFLTTKVRPSHFERPKVLSSTRESLKKLQVDYIDLLLMHWPNPTVPLAQTLEAMLELQREGAIRHIGVSNFPPSLVQEAQRHAPIFCNQVEYHPYLGQSKLLKQAREMGYLLTAYSPIAKGMVLHDPVLREIGERHGKTPVQITLRWLLQQPQVAAIPKAATRAHREANLAIFDFKLSDEEMAQIFALERNERLVNPEDAPDWEA